MLQVAAMIYSIVTLVAWWPGGLVANVHLAGGWWLVAGGWWLVAGVSGGRVVGASGRWGDPSIYV